MLLRKGTQALEWLHCGAVTGGRLGLGWCVRYEQISDEKLSVSSKLANSALKCVKILHPI